MILHTKFFIPGVPPNFSSCGSWICNQWNKKALRLGAPVATNETRTSRKRHWHWALLWQPMKQDFLAKGIDIRRFCLQRMKQLPSTTLWPLFTILFDAGQWIVIWLLIDSNEKTIYANKTSWDIPCHVILSSVSYFHLLITNIFLHPTTVPRKDSHSIWSSSSSIVKVNVNSCCNSLGCGDSAVSNWEFW